MFCKHVRKAFQLNQTETEKREFSNNIVCCKATDSKSVNIIPDSLQLGFLMLSIMNNCYCNNNTYYYYKVSNNGQ